MKKTTTLLSLLFLGYSTINAQSDLKFSDAPSDFKGHRTSVGDAAFSPDGKLLATCGGKNQMIVFSVPGGQIKMKSPEGEMGKPLNFLDFNPNGKEVAVTGYTANNIQIWDVTTGKLARKIGDYGGFSDINYSPDGKYIAVAGRPDGTQKQHIEIWDASTGANVKTLFKEGSDKTFPTTAIFSPDGKYVACGISNVNQGIRIWEVASGNLVKTINHKTDVSHIDYSPDGKYITGGGLDKKVYIWEASSGNLIRTMKGEHNGYVSAVDYSPDGQYVISSAMHNKCKFKLWNAATAELVQTIGKRGADVNEAIFSPNGQSVVIALQTYGDAFDVATVLVYNTGKAVEMADWYVFENAASGLRTEFPVKPEYTSERKGSYTYHHVKLTHSYCNYHTYVEQYHIGLTDAKRDAAEIKMANFYKNGMEVLSESTFEYKGEKGIELVVKKGTSRYAYRIIFIGDKLYRASFGSRNKEASPEEKRYLKSMGVNGSRGSSSNTSSNTSTTTIASTPNWKKHFSGKGKYSIAFPGKPVLDTKKNENGNISYTASIRVANQDYIVVASDYSATMKGKQLSKYLNKSAETYLKVTKAEVVHKKSTSIRGKKGLDYVLKKGDVRYRYRVTSSGDFIYWIVYVAKSDQETANELKFINSFMAN